MNSYKKTAVYCRTIEEYNIVTKHYGRKLEEYFTEYGWYCIKTDFPYGSHSVGGDSRYTDILFDEWILTEMPKVGDKVIITKSEENWISGMDEYNNTIQIVNSINSKTGTLLRFKRDDGWDWNFNQKHFRIATPEEIAIYENPVKDKYVKITRSGLMYTTHGKAEEYGCTNYAYDGILSNDTICKVIATPYINNNCDGYVLEYNKKHYLIEQSGTIPSTKEEYESQFNKIVKDLPKEPVYIAGKWYKLNNCWYAKCSEDSFDREKFYGNESYNSSGEHDDTKIVTTLKEQNSIIELTESAIDDKTPIELKSIILNNMKDGTRPEPKYSKYTIKLNSEEEYKQCLDYFENILKNSVDRRLGFTPTWNKFKYNKSSKQWKLYGYDDTMEYIVSFQDFINNITKIPYKLTPKFSKGDKVKVCSSEEDVYKDGFMYSGGTIYQISGVAGDIKTLTGEIKEKNGNIYYGYKESGAWIKESCLSLIENKIKPDDSIMTSKQEDKITEYAGLKVGDVLKESDINEWEKIGENYEFSGVWEKSSGTFCGDKKINSFKLINGVVGFEVSETSSVYSRADGYLDFIKNKDTEEDDSSLEITSVKTNTPTDKFNGDTIIPHDCPFKEGDSVSCIINGTTIDDGKIHFEDNYIFICQNEIDGYYCENRLGYLYSWIIYASEYNKNFTSGLKSNDIENLKLKEVLNDIKEEDYSQKTLNLLKKQITII